MFYENIEYCYENRIPVVANIYIFANTILFS